MNFPAFAAFWLLLIASLTACGPSQPKPSALDLAREQAEKLSDAQFEQALAQQNTPIHDEGEALRYLLRMSESQGGAAVQRVLVGQPSDSTQTPLSMPARQAALRMAVRDFQDSRRKIDQILKKHQAEVLDEDERRSELKIESNLLIQVPQARLDSLMQGMRDLALLIRQKKIWTQELNMQHLDVQTQLQHKTQSREQLEKLLAKANSAEEVLPIRRELEKLSSETEALQRAARLLAQKQQHASLTLSFYQDLTPVLPSQAGFGQRMEEGMSQGWTSFKESLVWAAQNWVYLLLGLVLFLLLWFSFLASRRKDRQLKEQALQAQQQWLILQQQKNKN